MRKKIIKDKVSIITPMYNAEKFIGKTIDSVLAQTYENWELLIMNDMSKDNSCEVVKRHSKMDARIRLINASKNVGVVKGRNKLIDIADGEFIAEKQIKFMKEKDAAISCTDYTRVTENEKSINEIKVKSEITYTDLLKNNYMGCLTVMYDVSKVGKRYFKEREKNEDYVLWLEIIKEVKKVYGLQENLAFYRVLDNSRSSNKFAAAKVRWDIYRKEEGLSVLKSAYYFVIYAIIALLKTK